MFKKIQIIIIFLNVLFTTHAFSKSNEYYRTTLLHILSECSSECQKSVIEKEIKHIIYKILEKLLRKLELELLEKKLLTVRVDNEKNNTNNPYFNHFNSN
ncbi:hypothetical protein [Candidatus Pelagibacter sp. HIMB1506]|uniref:hypothetical protein n=1 Tax=Candidatus Pelagibacter sp. HIMB1506 TaxID=3413337 RepID=UPI003F8255CB